MDVYRREKGGGAVVVKMPMGYGHRKGLVGQLGYRLRHIANAGAAVDEQSRFVSLQKVHIHQLVLADQPGARSNLDHRSCKHTKHLLFC